MINMIKSLSLTLAIIFLLSACTDKSSNENSIIVGISADNPPYEFIQDGKIVGLDIDVINAIGKELDKEIIIKNLDFPGLLPALSSKNIDLVISAISQTPEREKAFDFSNVYATSEVAVIYRKSDNLKSIDDLSGKILGAQLGTTWEQEAKIIAEKFQATFVRSLSNILVLVEELKSGSVDVVILEEMQVNKFIKNNPSLSGFKVPQLTSKFAIAFTKDSDLKDKINMVIDKLNSSGKLAEIKKHWMH